MEEKVEIDERDMYNRFELFRKFLKNRNGLTASETIKLKAMGINFD